jgi:hypothetical protein
MSTKNEILPINDKSCLSFINTSSITCLPNGSKIKYVLKNNRCIIYELIDSKDNIINLELNYDKCLMFTLDNNKLLFIDHSKKIVVTDLDFNILKEIDSNILCQSEIKYQDKIIKINKSRLYISSYIQWNNTIYLFCTDFHIMWVMSIYINDYHEHLINIKHEYQFNYTNYGFSERQHFDIMTADNFTGYSLSKQFVLKLNDKVIISKYLLYINSILSNICNTIKIYNDKIYMTICKSYKCYELYIFDINTLELIKSNIQSNHDNDGYGCLIFTY